MANSRTKKTNRKHRIRRKKMKRRKRFRDLTLRRQRAEEKKRRFQPPLRAPVGLGNGSGASTTPRHSMRADDPVETLLEFDDLGFSSNRVTRLGNAGLDTVGKAIDAIVRRQVHPDGVGRDTLELVRQAAKMIDLQPSGA